MVSHREYATDLSYAELVYLLDRHGFMTVGVSGDDLPTAGERVDLALDGGGVTAVTVDRVCWQDGLNGERAWLEVS